MHAALNENVMLADLGVPVVDSKYLNTRLPVKSSDSAVGMTTEASLVVVYHCTPPLSVKQELTAPEPLIVSNPVAHDVISGRGVNRLQHVLLVGSGRYSNSNGSSSSYVSQQLSPPPQQQSALLARLPLTISSLESYIWSVTGKCSQCAKYASQSR